RSLSGERPTRSAASPARWLLPASGPDSMFSCACGPAPVWARRIGCVSAPVLAAGAGGGCQAGMTVVDSCWAGGAMIVRSAIGMGGAGGAGGGAIGGGGAAAGGPHAGGAPAGAPQDGGGAAGVAGAAGAAAHPGGAGGGAAAGGGGGGAAAGGGGGDGADAGGGGGGAAGGAGDCGVPGAPQPGDCAPVGRRAPHVDVDVPAGEPAGGAPQEGAGWAEPHVGCAPGAGAGAG